MDLPCSTDGPLESLLCSFLSSRQIECCETADEFYSTMGRLTQEMLEHDLLQSHELMQVSSSLGSLGQDAPDQGNDSYSSDTGRWRNTSASPLAWFFSPLVRVCLCSDKNLCHRRKKQKATCYLKMLRCNLKNKLGKNHQTFIMNPILRLKEAPPLLLFGVCKCRHVRVVAHLRRSEGNPQDLFLSFY